MCALFSSFFSVFIYVLIISSYREIDRLHRFSISLSRRRANYVIRGSANYFAKSSNECGAVQIPISPERESPNGESVFFANNHDNGDNRDSFFRDLSVSLFLLWAPRMSGENMFGDGGSRANFETMRRLKEDRDFKFDNRRGTLRGLPIRGS